MHLSGAICFECGYICAVCYSTWCFGAFFLTQIKSIGNLLGQGKARRAGVVARTSIFMAIAMAGIWRYVLLGFSECKLSIDLFCSTLFIVFRNKWAYLFNNDPEVVSLVASILPLAALFQVFDGTSGVVAGILRAREMQLAGALLNLR